MKTLALTISILILTVAALAQDTPKAELALGTYVGAGKVEGGNQSVRVVVNLGTTMIYYTGVKKCVAILETTEHDNVYHEIDQWNGSTVSSDSCKDKGFVFFELARGTATFHWGATAEEAMAKPSPILLHKTK